MKTLIIIAMLAIANIAAAQDNNVLPLQDMEKPVETPTYFYAELVGTANFGGNKIASVNIDFGQAKKYAEDTRLRNADGSIKKFNSMVDAMNWMGSMGWEFVQAYVVTMGNQNVYHWLMKKNTQNMSDAELESLTDVFATKKDFK